MTTMIALAARDGFPDDHTEYVCPGKHEDGGWTCMFCAGGLFLCTVCGSDEGASTTQCPGRRMTTTENEQVDAGRLDFRGGRWVAQPSYYAYGYWYWAWDHEEDAA
ncbi:hypothetical protein SEA_PHRAPPUCCINO_98 [Mycobacterium phage Phrappuccino]|uniref:Uncharacterized protein n=1 Tax=Mycobacterium phage Phrappuccino TaxID=2591223 RepID=A0A514DDT2_9CAUD|nr:hypothetical protein KHQ87_gp098 [Mycobacterium phage Phrappuccino]QDH91773.1 hypothetical protein SEA_PHRAPPUCCINO_98 [Mycobacterium phage Phrappuccino]QIQ63215.1 hypothetical protein SEA_SETTECANDELA_98 [Mycobacterium phage Settecandela]